MKAIAIQTARDGSKSVKHKNTLMVDGKPLYRWNLDFARTVNGISVCAISTDIKDAIEYAKSNKIDLVIRDNALCSDDASHHEVIVNALSIIEERYNTRFELVVVLLGNNRCAYPDQLDKALSLLDSGPEYDSVISVSKYNMFNPARAYKITSNGLLSTVMDQSSILESLMLDNTNDKNSLGDVYFFNGSFWVIRRDVLLANNGIMPFPWLGNKIYPMIQNPTCMEIDDTWQVQIVSG